MKCEPGLVNGIEEGGGPGAGAAEEGDRGWESSRLMLFVPRTLHKGYQGFWPFPEAYWPNIQASTLPPRTAHPLLRFACDPLEPALLPDFPWDKYELEPSPLTLKILSRRQPHLVWQVKYLPYSSLTLATRATGCPAQVFMEGSGRDASSIIGKAPGLGAPFGYLKAASDGRAVNLVLLPYNYPVLFPLIGSTRPSPLLTLPHQGGLLVRGAADEAEGEGEWVLAAPLRGLPPGHPALLLRAPEKGSGPPRPRTGHA